MVVQASTSSDEIEERRRPSQLSLQTQLENLKKIMEEHTDDLGETQTGQNNNGTENNNGTDDTNNNNDGTEYNNDGTDADNLGGTGHDNNGTEDRNDSENETERDRDVDNERGHRQPAAESVDKKIKKLSKEVRYD
ncbi:homeobox protein 6-like [Venturia canescens]|uniref:homeobox protein 6-like n=1 Tax=Venturia canescens TaxID=32260 RepID=UPI001C9D0902|nr:homeobox protein 6-like [Venturia canescens]XP_043271240.1 homeobox protein 6-like [Venturia canescens]